VKVKDKSWSKITPKLLAVVLEARLMPSRVTIWLDIISLRFLGPNTMTSVLSEFRSKTLWDIMALCLVGMLEALLTDYFHLVP